MNPSLKEEAAKASAEVQAYLYSDRMVFETKLEKSLALRLLRQSLIYEILAQQGVVYNLAAGLVDQVLGKGLPPTELHLSETRTLLDSLMVEHGLGTTPIPIGTGQWSLDDDPHAITSPETAYFSVYKEALMVMRDSRKRWGTRVKSFRLVYDPQKPEVQRFQVQVLCRTLWGGERWRVPKGHKYLTKSHIWWLVRRKDYHFQIQSAFEQALRDLDGASRFKVISYGPMSGGDKAGGLSTPME